MRRRHFLQLTGGLAITALLAGCGDSENFTPPLQEAGNPSSLPTARLSEDGLFEVDEISGRILELDPAEGVVKSLRADGTVLFSSTDIVNPIAGVANPDGGAYVLDLGANEVVVFSPDGGVLARVSNEVLAFAVDIAFGNNELYVLDHINLKVNVFSPTGELLRTLAVGSAGSHLRALVVDREGNLRVLDSNPVQVTILDPQTGRVLDIYATEGAESARDLDVRPDGSTLLVDHLNSKVVLYDAQGAFVETRNVLDQDGQVAQPLRLALGPAGELYLSISEVA